MRVALFGSFYRGFHVLHELISGPLASRLTIVGVATDDPEQRYVTPQRRVWQYGYRPEEATMVADLAARNGIELYRAKVKDDAFYDMFEACWRPDVCVMATFGQKLNARIFSWPKFGVINLHPSDNRGWPSKYAGSNPFQMMLDDGLDKCVISLHMVNEDFDAGQRLCVSEDIYIPPGATVRDMHMMSSPIAALTVRKCLGELLARNQALSA